MADQSFKEIHLKLLERRDFLRKELLALESLLSLYEGLDRAKFSESTPDDSQLSFHQWPSSRPAQAAEIARTIEAARKLILKKQRPMKRGELVVALEALGHTFPGKDKNKVFGTNLWRSGKFRTVDHDGYWPKDTPLPKQ